ncbi:MAG TPA: COX15/CtaA family protein [Streptosporangiaceae bacterium]|nr:COX15/CtaA family protein [Streptosporangiaceae bacterium]
MSADLAPAGSAPGTLPASPLRRALSRITGPVLAPGPVAMRNIALAAVVANAVIMMTGAAVRLTQSGLGCPDWPKCTAGSLTPARVPGQTMLNTWTEFGNRLITYPVVAVGIVALIAAWQFRPPGTTRRRRDLVWLAAALPAGVAAQAVLGGIVVLTKLNPAWVAVHFLVSIAIVGAAVMLHIRCQEGTGRPRPLVRTDLRLLGGALTAVTAVMIAAGTVVDGAGPLAGNAAAPRFPLPFTAVTQFHADIGWLMGGLALALAGGLRLSGAPRPAVRRGWAAIGLIAVQGVIGYVQYFGGMPAGLVWVHVCVAVLIWIAVLRLMFALRDRGTAGAEHDPDPVSRETTAARAGEAPAAGA